MLQTLFLLVSLAVVAQAQVPGLGACPNVATLKTIDTKKLAGKWYESERYNAFFDNGKCVVHNLYDLGFGHFLTTSTTDVTSNVVNTHIGVTSFVPGLQGQMFAVYPIVQLPIPVPFNIVNTDYTTYAVAYTCIDLGFANIKFAWIFTRDKVASSGATNAAYAAMDWVKIDRTILQKVDQTCLASR